MARLLPSDAGRGNRGEACTQIPTASARCFFSAVLDGLGAQLDIQTADTDGQEAPPLGAEVDTELVPCDGITFQLMDVEERTAVGSPSWPTGAPCRSRGTLEIRRIPAVRPLSTRRWQVLGGVLRPRRLFLRGPISAWCCAARTGWAGGSTPGPDGSDEPEAGSQNELQASREPFVGLDRRLLLFRSDGADFTDREVQIIRIISATAATCPVMAWAQGARLRGSRRSTSKRRRSSTLPTSWWSAEAEGGAA